MRLMPGGVVNRVSVNCQRRGGFAGLVLLVVAVASWCGIDCLGAEVPAPQREKTGPEVTAFKLASRPWGSAYDPVKGRIAVGHDGSGFLVYSVESLLKEPGQPDGVLAVTGNPVEVHYASWKGKRYFLASGSKEMELDIYDADSCAKVKTLPIGRYYLVTKMASSGSSEDPNVFLTVSSLSIRRDSIAGGAGLRFNLRTLDVEHQWAQNFMIHDVCVSSDGKQLYCRPERGRPGSFRIVNVDNISGGWIRRPGVKDDPKPQTIPELVPVAGEKQLAVNQTIYSSMTQEEVRTLEFTPRAYFRKAPLVAGVRDESIVVASTIDDKVLTEIKLPAEWLEKKDQLDTDVDKTLDWRARSLQEYGLWARYLAMFPDEERNRLIVVLNQHLLVIPLKDVPVAKEPVAKKEDLFPANVSVGDELTISLPEVGKEAKVSVKDVSPELPGEHQELPARTEFNREQTIRRPPGPPDRERDVTVPRWVGGAVKWTPARDDVGTRSFEIAISDGTKPQKMTWECGVRFPYVDVDWYVKGIAFDDKGSLLMVWGDHETSQFPSNGPLPLSMLAIIDVKTRKVKVEKEMPYHIERGAIGPTGVYTVHIVDPNPQAPAKSLPNSLRKLDPETLTLQAEQTLDHKNTFQRTEVFVQRMDVIPGKELVLSGVPTYRMNLETLKEVTPAEETAGPIDGQFADGWLWRGTLWDKDLKQRKLLMFPTRRLSKGGWRSSLLLATKAGIAWPLSRGNVVCSLLPGNRERLRGYRVEPYQPLQFSFEFPGVVDRGGDRFRSLTSVGMYSIEPEAPAGSSHYDTIELQPDRAGSLAGSDLRDQVVTAPGVGVLGIGKRLVFFRANQFRLPERKEPRFDPEQSKLVLSSDGTTAVQYRASNAVEYDVQLWVHPDLLQPYLSLTSETGKFDINLKPLRKELLSCVQHQYAALNSHSGRADIDQAKNFRVELKEAREEYQRITGKACGGVPIVLLAAVGATNATGGRGALCHFYLTELPLGVVRGEFKF